MSKVARLMAPLRFTVEVTLLCTIPVFRWELAARVFL
jgi:hypothetical protein